MITNVTYFRKIPHPLVLSKNNTSLLIKKTIKGRKSLHKSKEHSSLNISFIPSSDISNSKINAALNPDNELLAFDYRSKIIEATKRSNSNKLNVNIHEIMYNKKNEHIEKTINKLPFKKINPHIKQRRNYSTVKIPRIFYQNLTLLEDISCANNDLSIISDSKIDPKLKRNSIKCLSMPLSIIPKSKGSHNICVSLYQAEEVKKLIKYQEAREVKKKRLKEDYFKSIKKHRFDQFRMDLKHEMENIRYLLSNIAQSQIVQDENMKYYMSKIRLKLHNQDFL